MFNLTCKNFFVKLCNKRLNHVSEELLTAMK